MGEQWVEFIVPPGDEPLAEASLRSEIEKCEEETRSGCNLDLMERGGGVCVAMCSPDKAESCGLHLLGVQSLWKPV